MSGATMGSIRLGRGLLVAACAASVAMAVWTAGCSPLTPRRVGAQTLAPGAAPTDSGSANGAQVAGPINDFGFDMLRRLDAQKDRGPQTVISPLSIHADLAMVANGANATTLAEMRRTLRLDGLDEASSNASYAGLLGQLNASTDVTMSVANSLWIDNTFVVKQPFLDADTRYFGAEVREMPLATEEAKNAVNAWVSKATRGKIPQTLDKAPDPGTSLIAVNATYFDGTWASPFHPENTRPEVFATPSGSTKVPMMHGDAATQYAQGPGFEAVRLPYAGHAHSMVVILPSRSSSLDALEASMTAEGFSAMLTALHHEDIVLSLPRVELDWSQWLTDDLKGMGMASAFDPTAANLGRIGSGPSGEPLFISDVIHKTYLRVDEKGTEAAAVTATVGRIGAKAVVVPIIFTVDRPYLMAIVDDRTGAVLFLAAVRDPR